MNTCYCLFVTVPPIVQPSIIKCVSIFFCSVRLLIVGIIERVIDWSLDTIILETYVIHLHEILRLVHNSKIQKQQLILP